MNDTTNASNAELAAALKAAQQRAERLEAEAAAAEERFAQELARTARGNKPFIAPGMFAGASAKVEEFKATFEMPSWTRVIITAVVVAAAGIGIYMCAGVLAGAAFALSIPVFLQWVLAFLAYAVAAYFGGKILMGIGKYFLTRKIDHDLANARDGVFHAFQPSQKAPQEVCIVEPRAA